MFNFNKVSKSLILYFKPCNSQLLKEITFMPVKYITLSNALDFGYKIISKCILTEVYYFLITE